MITASGTVDYIFSYGLAYAIYAMCAVLVGMMALFSWKLAKLDEAKRARERARREWEESPEGQAALHAEALEMEAAAEALDRQRQRERLEAHWPQYTIVLDVS